MSGAGDDYVSECESLAENWSALHALEATHALLQYYDPATKSLLKREELVTVVWNKADSELTTEHYMLHLLSRYNAKLREVTEQLKRRPVAAS